MSGIFCILPHDINGRGKGHYNNSSGNTASAMAL